MRTAGALEVLKAHRPNSGVESEFGVRGDAAYVRLWNTAAPERWAVVSSPGDRWFAIDVDGGFGLTYVEEDTPDAEAVEWLRKHLEIANQYLRQLPTPVRAGVLRLHRINVAVGDREVSLRQSLSAVLTRFVKPRRRG